MKNRLVLYNTLSRKKEQFEPINPPFVGLYVCGPTVYGDAHLGHARPAITFDLLFRYLKYLGYKVVYRIQNRFTGKMMDLDMGGVSDGTRVHQWEGAQASSQLWVVEPINDGRVKIKSNLAGKLLDPGMATENGTVLQIWADVNGDNQFWTINEVTRKPKTSVKATTVKAKAAAEKAATEVVKAAEPVVEKAVKAAKPAAEKAV